MRTAVGAAATVVAGALAIGALGASLARSSAQPPRHRAKVAGTISTPQGVLPHAFLKLDTWPDSLAGPHGIDGGAHPDWVSFGPSTTLVVPAHSLVTVTVKQYDFNERITNPFFATVRGTVDGTITIDGKKVTHIDPAQLAHTFTVHDRPGDSGGVMLSVPLPAVPDNSVVLDNGYPAPHEVVFSFITGAPGEFYWQCEFPCGDGFYAGMGGPMSTESYMSGTLSVVAQ